MTRLALRNPLAILMIGIALIVFAGVVTPRMSIDTFPELSPPVLVVGTVAPGLGPKDVEKTISWRLEKYVGAVPGVDRVESISRTNLSVIYVWLKWGTDLGATQGLVQQQAAFAMAAVPKSLGVLPPFVLQYDPSNAPVIQVAIHGGDLSGPQLYDYAQNVIEPILEGIEGVASASPNGGRARQINVVVDPLKAQARGVTTGEVADAVRATNALLPSGKFVTSNFDANIYTDAVPGKIETIEEGVVKVVDGRPVLVRDVAEIVDGASPATQGVAIDGKDGVYLNVLRVPGGNTLKIVEEVKAKLAALDDLPPGLKVTPVFDQSTFVRTTYHGLRKEIAQALVLIGAVILIFLQSPRSVLICAISIPLSFAAILIVLYACGQTLNAFTLGGLTLAMGPLVDLSVVVLEAIHRKRHEGASPLVAALEGARTVALPAFAAMLVTIAVLLPVVLLEGLARKLFAPLALTVAIGMIAGYAVSMAVTPVACRYLLSERGPGPLARKVAAVVAMPGALYVRLLGVVLPHRGAVLVSAAAIVGASAFAATRLPSTFFPEIDESMERIYVRLAPGTSIEEATSKVVEIGETLRRELPPGSVKLVLANVGSPKAPRSAMNSPNVGPHMGFLRLELADPEERTHDQRAIADLSRQLLEERYPGVEFQQAPGGLVASVFGEGYKTPFVVEVAGDDLDGLADRADAVATVLRRVPGLRDLQVSLELDYPEVRIAGDRTKAGLAGASAQLLAQRTLEATYGNINAPSVWTDPGNGQSYYVVTAADPASVTDVPSLMQVPLRVSKTGAPVVIGAFAEVARSAGPIAIERSHHHRVARISGVPEGRDLGSVAADARRALADDPKTSGIEARFVGQVALMERTFGGIGLAVALAVMLVFMIMAVQFRSLRLPFVMLFAIPVALVGIVLALRAAGQGFSVTALMGILMVVGIATSNGILLVDHANRVVATGASRVDAILDAARVRFLPILMTSLATIVGLLPTALGLERGAEANRPLALAVVGGLSSSTLLSLFLVPTIFVLLAPTKPSQPEPELAP
jgi:multidrug efflux pump subunit AcrB